MAGLSPSQSFGSSIGLQSDSTAPPPDAHPPVEQPKYFFREKYAKLGVKGNFMPLAAQPINIGLADWLAHQSKLSNFVFVIFHSCNGVKLLKIIDWLAAL